MTDGLPILTTPRLTMTPFTAGDFEDCAAVRSDASVTRFVGGVLTREEVWSRILRYAGMWAVLGYSYWAVRETATGRFVGEIGLTDYRREMTPSFAGTPEAGWVTAAWAHGQGLASEAVGAMLDWSDAHLETARTVSMIAPENVASIRLAERHGYRRYAETRYKGYPVVLFERPRGGGA